jgi:hypothetical protein
VLQGTQGALCTCLAALLAGGAWTCMGTEFGAGGLLRHRVGAVQGVKKPCVPDWLFLMKRAAVILPATSCVVTGSATAAQARRLCDFPSLGPLPVLCCAAWASMLCCPPYSLSQGAIVWSQLHRPSLNQSAARGRRRQRTGQTRLMGGGGGQSGHRRLKGGKLQEQARPTQAPPSQAPSTYRPRARRSRRCRCRARRCGRPRWPGRRGWCRAPMPAGWWRR